MVGSRVCMSSRISDLLCRFQPRVSQSLPGGLHGVHLDLRLPEAVSLHVWPVWSSHVQHS